jgi:hypothetical protein
VDLGSPHVKNKMSKREFIRNTRNAVVGGAGPRGQGSILQNSVSANNFSDKFSSSDFGQSFSPKQEPILRLLNLQLERFSKLK